MCIWMLSYVQYLKIEYHWNPLKFIIVEYLPIFLFSLTIFCKLYPENIFIHYSYLAYFFPSVSIDTEKNFGKTVYTEKLFYRNFQVTCCIFFIHLPHIKNVVSSFIYLNFFHSTLFIRLRICKSSFYLRLMIIRRWKMIRFIIWFPYKEFLGLNSNKTKIHTLIRNYLRIFD